LIIDDKSSDRSINKFLKNYSEKNKLKKIKVVFNKKNLGFSETVNYGIKLSKNNDVIILNSDTIVTHRSGRKACKELHTVYH